MKDGNMQMNLSLKFRLLVCLFTFISSYSYSQFLEGHYIPFGLGYAHQVVKDKSLSPVSYSGGIAEINIGYYYQNKRWLSSFDLSGFGGFQNPDVARSENNNSTLLIAARAIYSLSHIILKIKKTHFRMGLQSHNSWDFRQVRAYGNSSANYNGLFSLGPYLNIQNNFSLFKQNFIVQYGMSIPLGTYYLRPGYIKPFLNNDFSATGFAYWGEYFQLNTRSDLYWKINESNFLRLSYTWEYTSLEVMNKLQVANHFLSISTIFKL